MHLYLNDKLVEDIKRHVPHNAQLVDTLSDMLSLGKEAIYRRLKGDVPFTFEEAVRIAAHFNLSIDRIMQSVDFGNNSRARRGDILSGSAEHYMDRYRHLLEALGEGLLNIYSKGSGAVFQTAANQLPYNLFARFEMLARFEVYKWAFLKEGSRPGFGLVNMIKRPDVLQAEARLLEICENMPHIRLILDRNIFRNIAANIRYFVRRELITPTECGQLKLELERLIDGLEQICSQGVNAAGSEVMIYLSDIALDSTYSLIENGNEIASVSRVHFIDYIFNTQRQDQEDKIWIESLKRYSTLITQSGETERFGFFSEQRRMLETTL